MEQEMHTLEILGPILTIQAHGLKRTAQVHSGRDRIHFC